ncbi:hypothetical protein [Sodalis-like endosymbiont of Proechinophthirus fluctus]|nr:hypothetical protein [Sodalis-like endosymbiont of Proechinophthirus fluctus]
MVVFVRNGKSVRRDVRWRQRVGISTAKDPDVSGGCEALSSRLFAAAP